MIGRTTPFEPTADYTPGDPEGVEFDGEDTYSRSLPIPLPSPWSGWPAEWGTPRWDTDTGLNNLIDVAWSAIDLNSSVLGNMPVYRLQSGKIIAPTSWMTNPDPSMYASWFEFAKELFWNFHLGEAFVLSMSRGADGYPLRMRVVPNWLVNVELRGGVREYSIGGQDVTDDLLHIRYQSNMADAHGHGPLECAGARITAAGLLQRYAHRLAETGGVPLYWIDVERRLTQTEANDLIAQWVESRTRNAAYPALLSGGASLNQMASMSARDMVLLELSQFNEFRIAILLGVPPFLMGLPAGSGGDGSMTYSNVSQLFTFHDKASLQPKANAVMSALSNWALPRGQTVELNRDEYSRPPLKERAEAYKILIDAGVMGAQEVRDMERLHGDYAASALAGTTTVSPSPPTPSPNGVQQGDVNNAVGN